MICIYTRDDCTWCTCSSCSHRRDGAAREAIAALEQGARATIPVRPFLHQRFDMPEMIDLLRGPGVPAGVKGRRRPCPIGMPGSLDGVVPYQPSRCSSGCTCCAWCRGEVVAIAKPWCTCPVRFNWSNCERDHSEFVQCRDGCKPRPPAMAIVVARPSWIERALRWIARRLAL